MVINMPGIHCQASTNRCTIKSNQPPITALRVPITTDNRVDKAVTARQRMTEVRAP